MILRTTSIAVRLTAGLGLASLLVFTVAGTLLHRALAAELAAADATKLAGKVRVVQHFIDEAVRSADRRELFHHLDDLRLGHDELYVWITSAAREPVYGGPLPVMLRDARGLVPSTGVEVDVVSAPLDQSSPWPGGGLQVAMTVRPREDLLRGHLLTLLLVCTAGVAATVLLSWLAVRDGLRIVSRLSAEAWSITPRSLGRRLSEPPKQVELHGLVRAFNHVLDRLEAAYDQLRAFNANVAHELRTPLASMITGTQVALAASRPREDLQALLSSNLEELELLNGLVNDMLFLSRADRGDRAEGLEEIDLGVEADKAICYCEAMFHEARTRAQRLGQAMISCNAPLMQRALVNLLTNAIRHTAAEGVVIVRIVADAQVVRLSVENPGAPIAPAVQARMFDRFYQADRARNGAGRGHGLAIVAGVARLHGGTVFADRSGTYNRIGFTVPARTADAGSAEISAKASPRAILHSARQ